MRNPNRLGIAGGKLTAVLGTATLTSAAGGQAGAMRFLARRRAGPVLLGLAVAVAVPASAAAADASPVVGHVYVNDNTAGTNTIGAFDRHADGTLTSQTGSPFTAAALEPGRG